MERKVNLFDICNPKQWKTISAKDLLKEGKYPVYGANGIIGFYNEYNHSEETLLITCRGATCGSLNISEPFSYINGNAMALNNLSDEVNLKFLYYYLKVRGFNDVISGSAQPQITRQGLKKIQIPLPPLKTQKSIAARLDQAEAVKQLNQQLLAKYDALAQSVFLEMFGEKKSFKQDEIGNQVVFLNNKRIPVKASDRRLMQGKFPYYGASGIIDYVDDYLFNEETLLVGEDGANLISRSTPIAFRAKGKYWVNNHAHVISKNSKLNLIFLEYYINTINLEPYITGSAQPKLNNSNFKKILIPIPSNELQTKFARRIENIEHQKSLLRLEMAKSEELFESLLQESFSPL